jgi:hypothetical protein
VLTALADEVLHRTRAHRPQLMELLQEACPDVLALVQSSALDSTAVLGVKACALRCLASWLHAGVLLSELATDFPNLFEKLVLGIGCDSNEMVNLPGFPPLW